MIFTFSFIDATLPFRVLLETLNEGVRGLILFLVAMYFLKKSSKILKDRHMWGRITNYYIGVVFITFVAVEVICGIYVYAADRTEFNSCCYLTDLMLQVDMVLVLTLFFVMAIFISRRIKEQV